jgi:hypothetical protein
MAVTPEQIEASIEAGIEWLVGQQDPDTGQWQDVPRTGFVLIKLQDRAYELGKDPFETDPCEPDYYVYGPNVIKGWEYIFAVDGGGNPVHALKQDISDQNHISGATGTIDDPDTRVNGYGIYFSPYSVYSSGICLMALAASRAPSRVNDGGIDYDGDGNADTFGEIAQDVVDWLAFAQADVGTYEGGYYYQDMNNVCWGADNSNSGYAYLGLAAAEGFSCTVPQWVKDELDVWIDHIQNDQGVADDGGEPTPDGGSGYVHASNWVNELKTGNLIFEMTFYGDDPCTTRFQYAMDYIERHWQDNNLQPGFRGDAGIDDDGDMLIDEDPDNGFDDDGDGLIDEDMGLSNHYQAMYCLMKGLEYSAIDLLDLDGNNVPEHDWFQELATILLNDQNLDGSWPSSPCYVWTDGQPGTMSGTVLSTVWALLTLEKITPPPPVITVSLDIKPQSCPNPLNVRSRGLLPLAILGSEDFDVTTIDVSTIRLEGVAPIRSNYEDVATPVDGEECECTTKGPDGYLDLTLKFKTQDIVAALGEVVNGEVLVLTLTGELSDGTSIEGEDCIRVKKPTAIRAFRTARGSRRRHPMSKRKVNMNNYK